VLKNARAFALDAGEVLVRENVTAAGKKDSAADGV
jgi:hypothetical protein